jgi:hypothetical protein
MGSIYISYGIKASQSGEVLQTRTRTGVTSNQRQTRTRSCSSTTRYTNTYWRGNISGGGTQQTRRERMCQTGTTCSWVYTGSTNIATQPYQDPSFTSGSGCNSSDQKYECFQDDPWGTLYNCWIYRGSSSSTYTFGSWSSYYDYNGSSCSGISSCGSSTIGQYQYECSSRPVPSTCSWEQFSSSDDSVCLANNISCTSATTSNPDIDCSSYTSCSCGSWSPWSNVSSCNTQNSSVSGCTSNLIVDCQTIEVCNWGAWTDWTEVQSCTAVTPSCSNNAIQRECRII